MKTDISQRILIADDDIDYLFQMKVVIEKFGFDVITAESQKEAEEILSVLQEVLSSYELELNSSKTEITKLPEEIEFIF